ncbi:MAG: hypothetical protein ACOCXK_02475 [Rhodosalinus sp.]
MTEKIETQIAVWTSGPTVKDERRLFLVLDVGTGSLSARIEVDEYDQATDRVVSTTEDVSLASVLEMDDPSLFSEKLRRRLDILMTGDAREAAA